MSISRETKELNTVSPIDLKSLTALVKIGDTFTRTEAHKLLQNSSKGKSISEPQTRRYITWCLKLHLFEEREGTYYRTPEGRILADQDTGTAEWRNFLHQLLLNDSVYKRFIEVLAQHPRFEHFETIERAGGWVGREMQEDNHVTPKTLRTWTIELNILARLPVKQRFILIDPKISPSTTEFWQKLLYTFRSLLLTEKHNRFSVRIGSVRDEFCYRWRLHPDHFDSLLRGIFLSKEYSSKIHLSGGPARYIRELKRKGYHPLSVNRKEYMYITILTSE